MVRCLYMLWFSLIIIGALTVWVLSKNKAKTRPQSLSKSRMDRKKIHLPLMIEAPYNQSFSVSSYDMSMGGLFIGFKDLDESMNRTAILGQRSGLKVGDKIRIHIHSGRFRRITCEGRVVRIESSSKGGYPDGIGIQFTNLGKTNRKKLKNLLQFTSYKAQAA